MGPNATPEIGLLFHAFDRERAQIIGSALTAAGMRVRAGFWSPDCAAIVVLLSPELLEVPDQLPAAVQVAESRLVPVLTRRVDGVSVPADLAALNWIPWHDADPSTAVRAIVSACSTDLAAFHAVQALTARAEGWQLAGRNNADLISNRRQLASAEAAVQQAGGVETSELVTEFLTASQAATRSHRIKSLLQRGGILVLAAILVVAIVTLTTQLAYIREREKLDLATSRPQLLFYPPGHTLIATALIQLQQSKGDEPSPVAVDAVVGLMSEPWPTTRFQMSPDGMFLAAAEMADDGSMLWLDGQGGLWRVPSSGVGGERLGVPMAAAAPGEPLTTLAADANWQTVAVADQSRLTIASRGTRQELSVAGISDLVMDPGGTELAVLTEEGQAEWIDVTRPERNPERVVNDALAVGLVADRMTALRKTADGVELIALNDGARLRGLTSRGPVEAGVLGADGWLAVQTDDGQLWTAMPGEDFAPTGLRSGALAALRITTGGLLLYAPAGQPFTRAYDLQRRLPLENVCREGPAQHLRTSPDGHWLWCGYGADNTSWDLDAVRVRGDGTPDRAPSLTAEADGVAVSVTPNGILQVAAQAGEQRWDPAGVEAASGQVVPLSLQVAGAVSAVALGRGPIAPVVLIGSSAGDVVVADMHADGTLRSAGRWSTPDGSSVRALEVSDGAVVVTSSTARWETPACLNCSADPEILVQTVRPRLLACYPRSMLEVVPERLITELGPTICEVG